MRHSRSSPLVALLLSFGEYSILIDIFTFDRSVTRFLLSTLTRHSLARFRFLVLYNSSQRSSGVLRVMPRNLNG